MEQLKKERKQIILANLFCLLLLIFSIVKADGDFSGSMFLGIIEIILLIAYFDNRKGIRHYEKILKLYKQNLKAPYRK